MASCRGGFSDNLGYLTGIFRSKPAQCHPQFLLYVLGLAQMRSHIFKDIGVGYNKTYA
ncbi:MAG: hypothetical protein F6K31_06400 [Symploca sp. SIO2G7]|nr:hypothetical protein [Symploca sp. SIO2G7]